jgi:hypothetical protein
MLIGMYPPFSDLKSALMLEESRR